jgi:hypothetical protein
VKLDPGAHVFYAFGFALKSGCDNQIQDIGKILTSDKLKPFFSSSSA